ncbi:MAG TPA: glycosyltransferase family 9 protein, partial [Anseongella sp.]|nr:glycosyltransferase family 9 protein [Anseongella sp.]
MNIKKEEAKKIAVLRAGGLGDLIVTFPAIKAIKCAYPEAEIVLIAERMHNGLLERGRSAVDRVVVPPFSWHLPEEAGRSSEEIDAFFRAMQEEKFDIAVHFQGKGIAANQVIKKFKARVTAGNTCEGAVPPDHSLPFYYYQNEITRCLEVAGLIGARTVNLNPQINLLEEDRQEAREVLRQYRIKKPYILLHPGAMDIRRMWPAEKFASLGNVLAGRGYTIVITGAKEDHPAVSAVLSEMPPGAVSLYNCLSLGGLGALAAESALTVSNDTGPLHLARAVGAKTVGLYWAPN